MSISSHSRLSDILYEYPQLISVVNRFGINLGVGDKTISQLCKGVSVDENFVTAIINISIGQGNPIGESFRTYAPGLLVDYLRQTNAYYEKAMLPNIERHLNSLVNMSETGDNLDLLRKFFFEAKEELIARIKRDEKGFFPKLLSASSQEEIVYPLEERDKDALLADKFSDLANFFIVHLKGKYDHNLCVAVVSSIITLSKDLSHNNELRLIFS